MRLSPNPWPIGLREPKLVHAGNTVLWPYGRRLGRRVGVLLSERGRTPRYRTISEVVPFGERAPPLCPINGTGVRVHWRGGLTKGQSPRNAAPILYSKVPFIRCQSSWLSPRPLFPPFKST